ncbi:hypothetical protein O181_060173, partial [Austropuccinia psidii MF-1]|nr:hypothetical protein [Austropuccinia psidii MF-1]
MSYHLWPIGPLWVFNGSYATTHPNDHLLPQAISCRHWPSWPIHTSPTPKPSSLSLGLGGPFCLLGVSRPPSHHFSLGGLGPFRPPTVRGPWSAGLLGPFGPNQMRPKGGNHLAPKARWVPNHIWAHQSPKIGQIPLDPKLAKNHVGPIFGHGPLWTNIFVMASGNHQGPPNQFIQLFPQVKENSSIPPCTPYSRLQEWCIYGVIYHYAPFLLSNSMVTFSGLNSTFSSRHQNPTPILKEDFWTHQFGNPWWQAEDHSRTPTTWLCRSWVGTLIQDSSKVHSQ